MGFSKAQKVNRGVIKTLDNSVEIKFQYNPTDLTDMKAVNYRPKTPRGKYQPTYEFINGGERSLKFKIVIDCLHSSMSPEPDKTFSDKNIEKILDNFRHLIYPKETDWTPSGPKPKALGRGQKFSAPPICRFSFGKKVIRGIVKTLTIKETHFNASLEPVRAELNITFVEVHA